MSAQLANQTLPPASAGITGDVDGAAFKTCMRKLAGAVSVITVGEGEARTGFTATSVTSLSAEGPTILVTVNLGSSSWPAIETEKRFCVNVLSGEQYHVARSFSGYDGHKGAARYEGASWATMSTGAPVLDDALAAFDCEVEDIVIHRSHAVLIGLVRGVRTNPDAQPLLYWQGAFHELGHKRA
jgi:flavin reductase (DIM6/NTAB) family NADH-FMN oxidoreductase RutF